MKFLVVLFAVVACALASPGVISPIAHGYSGFPYLGYNYGYSYAASAPAHVAYAAPAAAHVAYAAPAAAHVAYAAPAAAHVAYAAPAAAHVAYAAAPIAAGVKTQYHAQDELGQASYGHSEPLQAHSAVQDAAGNKVGSFSYVSPEGNIFKTDYVADALGYRVASNALPVGPSHVPLPVADTPEVVAARAAHLAEHALAKSRARRGIIGHTPAATAPLAHHAPIAYAGHHYAHPIAHHYTHPIAYSAHHIAAPVAYSHAVPAVRAATLTTVVNTPGHAVSYRVD